MSINFTSTAPSTPGSITRSANECAGSAGNIYSISPLSGATSYTWSVTGTGWAVTAGGTTTSATITIGSGVGTVSVTATNACGTSGASTTGNIIPSTLPSITNISAPSAFCAGGSLNPTAPTVTANGSTVTAQGWQLETAVGSNSYTTISVPYTVAFADNGKKIRYYATNGCGTTNGIGVVITVNDKPTIAAILSPAALCAGGSLNPTPPSNTNNGSVVTLQGWQLETGIGTGSYSNLTVPYTVLFADDGKKIRYFATNGCGTTYGIGVVITVNPLPKIGSFN